MEINVIIAVLVLGIWVAAKCFNVEFEGEITQRRIRRACPPCPCSQKEPWSYRSGCKCSKCRGQRESEAAPAILCGLAVLAVGLLLVWFTWGLPGYASDFQKLLRLVGWVSAVLGSLLLIGGAGAAAEG